MKADAGECMLEYLLAVTLMSRLRNHAFIAHFSFFLCLICLPTSSPGQTEYILVSLSSLLSSQHLSALVSPYTVISTQTDLPVAGSLQLVSRDSN